jgi:hypothetical protein
LKAYGALKREYYAAEMDDDEDCPNQRQTLADAFFRADTMHDPVVKRLIPNIDPKMRVILRLVWMGKADKRVILRLVWIGKADKQQCAGLLVRYGIFGEDRKLVDAIRRQFCDVTIYNYFSNWLAIFLKRKKQTAGNRR